MKSGNDLKPVIERIHNDYFKSIDCGPGWTQLILDCHAELMKLDPDYELLQVKEKLGGLRYYVRPSRDNDRELWESMHKVVSRYETLSYTTCEETGGPGVLMRHKSGQLKTINPDAASQDWQPVARKEQS